MQTEYLYLNTNQLTGGIDDGICELPVLSYLKADCTVCGFNSTNTTNCCNDCE